ncbi:MAG: hypothetical protein WC376_05180 [Candidatus Nanoarchaeia archaeon]|jgi:hypothetical protein
MESAYSTHLIGANVASLPDFPFVDYNPADLVASKNASDAALKTYLGDAANRHAYNQSFLNIKTDFYNNGERVGYVIPKSDQLITLPGGSIDRDIFYNTSQFSQDMLNHLVDKNVDFAYYPLHDYASGTNLESVFNESGQTISVDPTFSQSTMSQFGAGAILAGLSLPAIGYGIRNISTGYKRDNKKKIALGSMQVAGGVSFNSWFWINMYNSSNLYNTTSNVTNTLLGIKGLCFNSGMFLIGNGIYNVFSSLKDYKKDPSSKGRAVSKAAFGGLEIASGSCFVSAGTKAMTSLVYEGSGLFSLSTQGLASILSTTIPWGIGLGIAALGVGTIYLVQWYKNKKSKKIKWLN